MAKQTAAFKKRERERHRRRNLRKRRNADKDVAALLRGSRSAALSTGKTEGLSDAEFRQRLEQAIGVDLDTGRELR